jgi:hypothetical protein
MLTVLLELLVVLESHVGGGSLELLLKLSKSLSSNDFSECEPREL